MKNKLMPQRPCLFMGLLVTAMFITLAACNNNGSTGSGSSKDSTAAKADTTNTMVNAEQKAANMKHYQEHLQRQQRFNDRMAALRKNNALAKTGKTKATKKNVAPGTKMAMAEPANVGSILCTGYLITTPQLQLLPAFINGGKATDAKRIGINIYDAIVPDSTGKLDTFFIFAPADSGASHAPDTISTDIKQFYFLSNGLCPQDCDLSVAAPVANVIPYAIAQQGVKGSFGAESPVNNNMLALNMTIMNKMMLVNGLTGLQITYGCLDNGTVVVEYVPLGAGGVYDGSVDISTDISPFTQSMLLPNPGK